MFYNRADLQIVAELPLPDPDQIIQDSWDLAFPQIIAWSTAATGLLLVVLLIKSFVNR